MNETEHELRARTLARLARVLWAGSDVPAGTAGYRMIDDLAAVCAAQGWDWGLQVSIAAGTMWAAELAVCWQPGNRSGPDLSSVWRAGEVGSVGEAMAAVCQAAIPTMRDMAAGAGG